MLFFVSRKFINELLFETTFKKHQVYYLADEQWGGKLKILFAIFRGE